MIRTATPAETYRRIDLDARAAGAAPAELAAICYEAAIAGFGAALLGAARGDPRGKSSGLTRAVAAITALQLGISDGEGVGDALGRFYAAAKRAALDSVLAFDAATIERLRGDFAEIAGAMRQAA